MSELSNFDRMSADMGLERSDDLSEEDFLNAIAGRVEWYLKYDIDMLLSYLYRLDVEERLINEALQPWREEEPQMALARLILDRQKQRILTKEKYKVKPIEGWEF
ncbi:MAG: hypothetical protein LC107_06185 [Chitinophagales bacterium]|nr:hypothetical protein [Chitinophagales bacterium]